MPGYVNFNLFINNPPTIYGIHINHKYGGIPLETIFEIEILNVLDDNLPLKYNYYFYDS